MCKPGLFGVMGATRRQNFVDVTHYTTFRHSRLYPILWGQVQDRSRKVQDKQIRTHHLRNL